MKPRAFPLPVYDIPADMLPEWPEDLRVLCSDCAHKSGYMCIRLKCAVHLLPVHCDSFLKRVGKVR